MQLSSRSRTNIFVARRTRCAGMMDLKKAMTKITELEEELKSTRDGYEEEISTLVEKNEDLKKKLSVFMGFPATGEGIDKDQGAGGRTQSYTRGLFGGNRRTSREE